MNRGDFRFELRCEELLEGVVIFLIVEIIRFYMMFVYFNFIFEIFFEKEEKIIITIVKNNNNSNYYYYNLE